jgi:hypothetical protein
VRSFSAGASIVTETATYPIEAGLLETIKKAKDLTSKAKDAAIKEAKEVGHHIAGNVKMTKEQIELAYREPRMGNVLKACGYSFGTAFGALHLAHKVAAEGALHVIAHLGEHHILHKLGHKAGHSKSGHSVDSVLKKYPVLKKLTGPALAGMILYGYTMTEPHKLGDWDMSSVKKAFNGEYGVSDFLQSSEAVALSAHVISGKALSLGALAGSVTTLGLGLACTAVIHSEHPKLKALGEGIKETFAAFKPKKSALEDLEVPQETLKAAFGGEVPAIGKQPAPEAKEPTKPNGDKETKDTTDKDPKQKDPPKKEKDDTKKGESTWWKSMSEDAQEQYLKDHPNSQFASRIESRLAFVSKTTRSSR